MDERLFAVGAVFAILAFFLIAGVVAEVQAPPEGKSISYYLKWLNANLINGGATSQAVSPGTSGAETVAGNIVMGSMINLDDGQIGCIYSLSDTKNIRVVVTGGDIVSTGGISYPTQKITKYYLDYSGGNEELTLVGTNTYYYVGTATSCASTQKVVPVCQIRVVGSLWGQGSGFEVSCGSNKWSFLSNGSDKVVLQNSHEGFVFNSDQKAELSANGKKIYDAFFNANDEGFFGDDELFVELVSSS